MKKLAVFGFVAALSASWSPSSVSAEPDTATPNTCYTYYFWVCKRVGGRSVCEPKDVIICRIDGPPIYPADICAEQEASGDLSAEVTCSVAE